MEEYIIGISPKAEKDLRKLKGKWKHFDDLIGVIDELSLNPRPCGIRKIRGFDQTYRIRFLSYRIIYDIYDRDKKINNLQFI